MRFLTVILILASAVASAQQPVAAAREAMQLKKVLIQYHIEPRLIDDNFSSRVYHHLLNELDEDRMIFTSGDIKKLAQFEEFLDNHINGNGWPFLPLLQETFKAGLVRAETMVASICAQPIDLKKIVAADTDTLWADETHIFKRWQIKLHLEIMQNLAAAKMLHPETKEEQFIQQQERTIRERVKLKNQRQINRILKHASGFENHVTSIFLRAISSAFDAHTVYLSPTQMENFMASLSTEGYYFGIDVDENERGELIISGVLPGGPGWKSGEINNGDVLEKIRWEGKEWMDLAGMNEYELDEILKESNHTNLELMLRKPGGLRHNVLLRKEKINTEEGVVRSFILEGRRKIGYIVLPDFYSNWGETEGARCANDVAKEIVKLRKENIDGLILDVRSNGGGSLAEAVAMTGIFIDGGPVGIEKSKNKEPVTIKDMNRGTVYDGPLVILVNGMSASASEFLAAALQDYRRAIIVGSRTFGKGIAQEMFSLEPGKPKVDFKAIGSGKPWGYATVTTSRIYRINGKSIQNKGVTPDVVLPDLFDLYDQRESNTPFAMKADSILKKTYAQQFDLLPLSLLQEKSKKRVADHPGFSAINRYQGAVKRYLLEEPEVLDWEKVKHRMENYHCEYKNLEQKLADPSAEFQVRVHADDKLGIASGQYAESLKQTWIKNLSRDLALDETFKIICDYIDTFTGN